MSVLLLNGGTRDEAIKLFDIKPPSNVIEECRRALDEQLAGFNSASDLDVVTHHPMGDVSVAQLFDFRILDLTVHSWDLARGIGANDEIPGELVSYVYAMVLPLQEVVGKLGIFGDGPSNFLAADAASQFKLLDLLGRRP
jgi:hypothetical protein